MAVSEKRYRYKSFRGGVYVNDLPNVKTPFAYNQDIDSPGAQLSVVCGVSPHAARVEVDELLDESDQAILDENDEPILSEVIHNTVGEGSAIDLNNDIEVWEYSDDDPAGQIVFQGYISTYTAEYGGSSDVSVIILSYGVELDNLIISGGSFTDQSQTTDNTSTQLFVDSGDKGAGWNIVGQTFIVGEAVPNIAGVRLKLASDTGNPVTFVVKLWNSTSQYFSGTPLASGSVVVSSTTPGIYTVAYSVPFEGTPGQTYFFSVENPGTSANTGSIYFRSSNVYANGAMQNSSYGGGSGGGTWLPIAGSDLYFETFFTSNETRNPFNNYDPSDIKRAILDGVNARGSRMTYDSNSIEDTNTEVDYTFQVNTALEGLKKSRELGPANWYSYGDVATNLWHYHPTSEVAQHVFVIGVHIPSLVLERTMENIRNDVYFSGGEVGDENLFLRFTNADSYSEWRPMLEKISDNRVTLTPTAQALSDDVLDRNAEPAYRTTVVITDATYDIKSVKLGDMVTFGGLTNMVNKLLLQVVSINRRAHSITVQLGDIVPRSTQRVEEIRRQLDKLQTINNPDSPG